MKKRQRDTASEQKRERERERERESERVRETETPSTLIRFNSCRFVQECATFKDDDALKSLSIWSETVCFRFSLKVCSSFSYHMNRFVMLLSNKGNMSYLRHVEKNSICKPGLTSKCKLIGFYQAVVNLL